jgi:hypothetical protein
MLGRIQRRPPPDATASEHLRWCRDVLLGFAAFGLVLGLPGLIGGSGGGKLLAVAAGACLLGAAQFWGMAVYFERRKPTARARPPKTTAESQLASDWLLTVSMFVITTIAAVAFEGAVSALAPLASIFGFATAAGRVAIYRYMPGSITMREQDRAQLVRLLKLAAILLGVGVVTSIAIAIGGGPASVGLWPAIAVGVLCGIVSLVQVAQATARLRRTRPV